MVYGKSLARAQTIAFLTNIADLERIINRITGNLAVPNELIALKRISNRLYSQTQRSIGK